MTDEPRRAYRWPPGLPYAVRPYGREHQRIRRQLLRDEPICQTPGCDRPSEHADHKVALALGGLTVRENYQALCAPCSRSKASREGSLIRHHGREGAKAILFGGED